MKRRHTLALKRVRFQLLIFKVREPISWSLKQLCSYLDLLSILLLLTVLYYSSIPGTTVVDYCTTVVYLVLLYY